MSAIIPENGDLQPEVVKVLFCLYPGFDLADVTGPLATLSAARHDKANANVRAFDCITAGPSVGEIHSKDGFSLVAKIDYKHATSMLSEIDVIIVPGGDFDSIIKAKDEPLAIIKAFADMQRKNPSRERTIFSISTGAFLLAQQGILAGQCATTHPDLYTKFENFCKSITSRDMDERTDLLEERYVVNNPRFDLGNEDDNPYIRRRGERRASNARKGSNSFRESNTRRESNARRMSLKLGGMRVITSGGTTTGFDAALYLVSAMVSLDAAAEVARVMQYDWQKGVVVRGVDV